MGNSLQYTLIGGKNSLEDKSKLLTKITYLELKSLRDNGKLIPGSLYRLTDYKCTTTQENTRSAGHQFDIVLLALSENKLAEEGWAMEHPTDVYDVTFSDGVTKKCWVYITDEENKVADLVIVDTLLGYASVGYDEDDELTLDTQNHTATCAFTIDEITDENLTYNYFQHSNLSAWKVWYCLDNDKDRFSWADDSIDEDEPAYIDIDADREALANGRFYRNPDNDYDNRYCWTSRSPSVFDIYTDEEIPAVSSTFSATAFYYDGDYESGRIVSYTPSAKHSNLPYGKGVIYRLIDEWNNDCPYDFKNILFIRKLTNGEYNVTSGVDTWVYTLNYWDTTCQDASIVSNTSYDLKVYGNKIGTVHSPTLNDNVFLTSGFECSCYFNTIGNNCYSNTFGNNCYSNTFGNDCYSNIFGNNCLRNSFGNNCYSNTFGNNCYSNTFGNSCFNNTCGFNYSFNTFRSSCMYNTFGNGCSSNVFGSGCSYNSFGNYCISNTFENNCLFNTFGTATSSTMTLKDYVQYIRVENGVKYTNITTSATTNSVNYLQNITVYQGISGTNTSRKTIIHPTVKDTFLTEYKPTSSQVINV